jgi:hypothetical protein
MMVAMSRIQDGLLRCGVVAGPLFVTTFTGLGVGREDHEVRREPVSMLALGRRGWMQRANFVVTGGLYLAAAAGLASQSKRVVGSRATPVLVAAAGLGLIGSGVFVTDPLTDPTAVNERSQPTRDGALHNLCAIPIFVGIPAAAVLSGRGFAKQGRTRWGRYSRGSGVVMAVTFVLFGAAFGQARALVRWGGLIQRVSIFSGFGWLTALSMRALRMASSPRRARVAMPFPARHEPPRAHGRATRHPAMRIRPDRPTRP